MNKLSLVLIALLIFLVGMGVANAVGITKARDLWEVTNMRNTFFDSNNIQVGKFNDASTTCYIMVPLNQASQMSNSISCVKVK